MILSEFDYQDIHYLTIITYYYNFVPVETMSIQLNLLYMKKN